MQGIFYFEAPDRCTRRILRNSLLLIGNQLAGIDLGVEIPTIVQGHVGAPSHAADSPVGLNPDFYVSHRFGVVGESGTICIAHGSSDDVEAAALITLSGDQVQHSGRIVLEVESEPVLFAAR